MQTHWLAWPGSIITWLLDEVKTDAISQQTCWDNFCRGGHDQIILHFSSYISCSVFVHIIFYQNLIYIWVIGFVIPDLLVLSSQVEQMSNRLGHPTGQPVVRLVGCLELLAVLLSVPLAVGTANGTDNRTDNGTANRTANKVATGQPIGQRTGQPTR